MTNTFQVGDARVTRIDELRWSDVQPAWLFPDLATEEPLVGGEALSPGSYDRATGRLAISIHSWLVQVGGRTVIVDTGAGNDKNLPEATGMRHLRQPFLDRLAAAGVQPDDVDAVLLTHIHADHVGWNTRFVDGRWVPTFRNARHVFSRTEWRYSASLAGDAAAPDLPPPPLGPPDHRPTDGVYQESVRPIVEAGLAEMIDVGGAEPLDGFTFLSTPGHSVDHASIRLRSRGEEAIFLGDLMHHPLQVHRPDLRSVFCEFLEPARASRRTVLEWAAEAGAVCFTTHFAESSAGRVRRQGDGFAWQFLGTKGATP